MEIPISLSGSLDAVPNGLSPVVSVSTHGSIHARSEGITAFSFSTVSISNLLSHPGPWWTQTGARR